MSSEENPINAEALAAVGPQRQATLLLQFAVGANGVHRNASVPINSPNVGRRKASREKPTAPDHRRRLNKWAEYGAIELPRDIDVCLVPNVENCVQP